MKKFPMELTQMTNIYEPRSDKRALNDVDDVIEKRRIKVASYFLCEDRVTQSAWRIE